MDLAPLNFEHSIGLSGKIITDGYVADSLEIRLSRRNLVKFRKVKPVSACVVMHDGEGKVVTAADAAITAEK
jgi:hypothetical protein